MKTLIDTGYGGLEKLRKDILFDFFRSAFDGSGADNFFDAGRCVRDTSGRLGGGCGGGAWRVLPLKFSWPVV